MGRSSNVEFVQAVSTELPFEDKQFDLIYDRRGPLSVIHEHRVLKSGGTVFGIHSGGLDDIRKSLSENGFDHLEIREFNALIRFPTEEDFAKFLMRLPGETRDLLSEDRKKELRDVCEQHTTDDGITYNEWRYIWKAIKL